MSVPRKHFDYSSPEVRQQVKDILVGAFIRQGTMLAFPTSFPGATVPIVLDESRITALDITPEGIVFGGTSGRRAHIFVGMFYGLSGMVFDMKTVDDADHCPAVCCGKKNLLACVNSPGRGGRIFLAPLQPLAPDLIEEWFIKRPAFSELGEAVPGEPIIHAVSDASLDTLVGVTSHHLFTVDFESGTIQTIGEVPGRGRLAVASEGCIVGQDGSTHLWTYTPQTRALRREAIRLPFGAWGEEPLIWSRGPGRLYAADNSGHLFSYDSEGGFSSSLGKTMLVPVGPMAVTVDGRLFGFCGSGIAKMFCYDPGRKGVADLGAAASFFERRRYGFVFGDAVTGREGELIFGEDDDLGHVWLYFPRIQSHSAKV